KHLPLKSSFWGGEKRTMWRQLLAAALAAPDHELAFTLYRRQVDVKEWQAAIERISAEHTDVEQINDELRRRQPEGGGLKLGEGVLTLLRRRGRDVMPYVRQKLDTIVGGWYGSAPDPLLHLARQRGWWDLWAAIVRTANEPKYFNRAVRELLDDGEPD